MSYNSIFFGLIAHKLEASNVVIMLCMDYTNIRTVSNNKTRIPQEKMSLNENLDNLLRKERKKG